MRRKRPWRRSEQDEQEDEQESVKAQVISDDEDANSDLTMGILAKACTRPHSNAIVLSDDDDIVDELPSGNTKNELPAYVAPSPPSPVDIPAHTGSSPTASATSGIPTVWTTGKKKKNKKKNKKSSKVTEANQNQNGVTQVNQNVSVVTEAKQHQSGNAKGGIVIKIIADDEEDNLEMRKLLRLPRYFDLPGLETCFRCGKPGHVVAHCPNEGRKSVCFVCGDSDHRGVKDCPLATNFKQKANQNKGSLGGTNFCLRCGDQDHQMFACDRDYNPDDLKGIQCYVCKEYGHLCCIDVALTSTREDTCYNCGEVGHIGLGCAKSRVDFESAKKSSRVCYACGEEGHFARGCSRRKEHDFWDEVRTAQLGARDPEGDFQGFQSVPAIVEARSHLRGERFMVHMPLSPVSRWAERWNMEGTDDRWQGGKMDYRFNGRSVHQEDWGRQEQAKHHKYARYRGHGEAGSSSGKWSKRRHRQHG